MVDIRVERRRSNEDVGADDRMDTNEEHEGPGTAEEGEHTNGAGSETPVADTPLFL